MDPVSPILLQTQVELTAQAGELGIRDTTRLENPFQAPMWLDEIRFHIPYVPQDPNANPIKVVPLRWSQLYVKLYLGNTPLTNGAVPISLLCKQLNDSPVPGPLAASGVPIVPIETSGGDQQPLTYNVYTWKLPKPLFIPARDYLRPVIYYAPSPSLTLPLEKVAVNIMYVVRPLPKGTPEPKTLQIPWATAYVPPFIGTSESVAPFNQTDQSTPADLFNPFEQDLHVQRFVGRFLNFQVGANANSAFNNYGDLFGVMQFADELVDFTNNTPLAGTFVSAQDSQNNILIRDPTPFYHVFNLLDRSWTVNCVLPAKGFYLFTVDRLWDYLGDTLEDTFIASVGIGMIGWRDVAYAQRDMG